MQTGTTPLGWNLVHSLPRAALHILKGAYGHCKVSCVQCSFYLFCIYYLQAPSWQEKLALYFKTSCLMHWLHTHHLEQVLLSLYYLCAHLGNTPFKLFILSVVNSMDTNVSIWKICWVEHDNCRITFASLFEKPGIITYLWNAICIDFQPCVNKCWIKPLICQIQTK